MLSAEWGWLDRCGGHRRGPPLKADDYPTVEPLVELWGKVEDWMRTFLGGLKTRNWSAPSHTRTHAVKRDPERVRLWAFARSAAEPRDAWTKESHTMARALASRGR
jgi:hypothetical protein